MMLALIHDSPATRPTAERLIKRLSDVGEQLAVFSDSDQRLDSPIVRFRPLREDGRDLTSEEIREQVARWQDANRIIFDVHTYLTPELAARLMELVDRAVYFVPADGADAAIRRLQAIDVTARGWRDKISVAWLIRATVPWSPPFRISQILPPAISKSTKRRRVCPLAGRWPMGWSGWSTTSAACAWAWPSAAGRPEACRTSACSRSSRQRHRRRYDRRHQRRRHDRHYVLLRPGSRLQRGCVRQGPSPSWIFRHLPQGNYWHLLYKYRRGHFDSMLRKYLHDWRLEQLAVPCLSVTVDLVSGNSVVRERGDAVHAILESINLPVLSVPIVRDGQALIDGGLVNNIPADVLVSMGCNFVIAASVTAKLETRFCDISAENPALSGNKPGIVPTIVAQPARSELQPERLRCSTGGCGYRAGRDGHRPLGVH